VTSLEDLHSSPVGRIDKAEWVELKIGFVYVCIDMLGENVVTCKLHQQRC